jgi:hypothetical protein
MLQVDTQQGITFKDTSELEVLLNGSTGFIIPIFGFKTRLG